MNFEREYVDLAAAIVRQAVSDYSDAYYEMISTRAYSEVYNRAVCDLYLIEEFFLSSWCGVLTFGNGERVLAAVKRKCKRRRT